VLGAVLLGTAPAQAAGLGSGPATVPGPVVLLGTGGLRWSDVGSGTPTLQRLLERNSSGWLAARSVRSVTCPVDGWLAVSAGRRAADLPAGPIAEPRQSGPACREPQVQVSAPGSAGVVPQWANYVKEAQADTFEATPGLLGTTLAGTGTAAVGPGAAIALADEQGRVPHAWAGALDTLPADVTSALATGPKLLAVDLGTVRDPEQRVDGEAPPTGAYARPRAEQVQALDTRLGLVLATLPADATVIVASLADSGPPSALQLLAATGPAPLGGTFTGSLLGSSSTRQDGLAQTTDLLPTALTALGITVPDDAVGSALKPVQPGHTATERRRKLDDLTEAATKVTPIVPWFFIGLIAGQVLLYSAVALRLRSGGRPNRRALLLLVRRAAVAFASVPAATFLANLLPWWRSGLPGLAVTGAVLLFTVPIAAVALLGPWRDALLGPMGAVGAITATVLTIDVFTGSHLIESSLMGLQPIVAGRFYGFGNVQFALFAAGVLMLATSLADWQVRLGHQRRAVVIIGVIGIVATAIDGAPGWGSDFGGPPALIPAFAVLALMVAGVRVTWQRALIIAAVTIAVIVALSVLDYLRAPGDRTHLGRFVQQVLDGEAWPVVRRKAAQNWGILFGSPLSALLPVVAGLFVWVLARPLRFGIRPLRLAYDRSAVLRYGLIAFGVMVLIGALLNDSGTVVPADASTVMMPLLIAASVRALELQDPERRASGTGTTPLPSPAPQ
jgi:hypothetical protein